MRTKFGLNQRNNVTPKRVELVFKIVKRLCKICTASSLITEHPLVALGFLCLDGIADEILPYFGQEVDFKEKA